MISEENEFAFDSELSKAIKIEAKEISHISNHNLTIKTDPDCIQENSSNEADLTTNCVQKHSDPTDFAFENDISKSHKKIKAEAKDVNQLTKSEIKIEEESDIGEDESELEKDDSEDNDSASETSDFQTAQKSDVNDNFSQKCPFKSCRKILTSVKELCGHMKTCKHILKNFDRNGNVFKCNYCKKSFKANHKNSLIRHIQSVHLKLKPHLCTICQKHFSTENNLKLHVSDVHDKIKTFKCKECKKTFPRKMHLDRHVRSVHEKIKDFECELCNKRFTAKRNLMMHSRTVHDKLKDFQCNTCDKKFTASQSLKNHQKNVHAEVKIKKFECHTCKKCFSQKGGLTQHIQTVHEKIAVFKSKNTSGVAGIEPGSPDLQFSNPRCHVQMH